MQAVALGTRQSTPEAWGFQFCWNKSTFGELLCLLKSHFKTELFKHSIIYIKNWDGIGLTSPVFSSITRGYSKRVHNKISVGITQRTLASPLSHPEQHTQDGCESLLCPVQIIQVCHTWAVSSPWLSPPPGLRSVPGTGRPLSGQLWLPCAALSLLSARSSKNTTELKTRCRHSKHQRDSQTQKYRRPSSEWSPLELCCSCL